MKQKALKSKNISQMMPVITVLKETLGGTLVAVVLFGSRARGEAHAIGKKTIQ